jgi:hypothetical protein
MIAVVKTGEYRETGSMLNMVYGKKDESLFTASHRSRLRDLAEGIEGETAKYAKLEAIEGVRGSASADETEPEAAEACGGGFTPPESPAASEPEAVGIGSDGCTPPDRKPTDERELEAVEEPSHSPEPGDTTARTAGQPPAGEESDAPSGSSGERPGAVSEQSGALVENKEAGRRTNREQS